MKSSVWYSRRDSNTAWPTIFHHLARFCRCLPLLHTYLPAPLGSLSLYKAPASHLALHDTIAKHSLSGSVPLARLVCLSSSSGNLLPWPCKRSSVALPSACHHTKAASPGSRFGPSRTTAPARSNSPRWITDTIASRAWSVARRAS
jgi:hypothetical protein